MHELYVETRRERERERWKKDERVGKREREERGENQVVRIDVFSLLIRFGAVRLTESSMPYESSSYKRPFIERSQLVLY